MKVDLAAAVIQARYSDEIPKVGALLNEKYRIEGVVGSGGMGIILAARHVDLDRPVAIKLLPPQARQDPSHVARFRREAKALASIKSAHIVDVLDYGSTTDGGVPYIVMERLEGTLLSELVESRERLPIAEAARYAMQAAEGVASAHRVGIVHRDLKPANMFIVTCDDFPILKVFDFGAAKAAAGSLLAHDGTLTRENSLIGSPRYMAPEQVRSVLTVDSRADIYSLGMTLYELLAGAPAFEGKSLQDILAQVLWEVPPRLSKVRSDVPTELEDIVHRCLEKAPRDRYQRMEDLSIALAKFAGIAPRGSQPSLSDFVPPEAPATPLVLANTPGAATVTLSMSAAAALPVQASDAPLPLTRRHRRLKRSMSRWVAATMSIALLGMLIVFASIGHAPEQATHTVVADATSRIGAAAIGPQVVITPTSVPTPPATSSTSRRTPEPPPKPLRKNDDPFSEFGPRK